MQWTLVTVVVALAVSSLGDDECSYKPGQKQVSAFGCCKVNDLIPETMKTSVGKCLEKFPLLKTSGHRPSGIPPTLSPEMLKVHICSAECIFKEEGLLTKDMKLDKAAIAKYFSTSDTALVPVVTAAIETCLKSSAAKVDTTLDCKSGTYEFQDCLKREIFLNCPSSLWTDTSDCEDYKTQVTKCTKMTISLGHH